MGGVYAYFQYSYLMNDNKEKTKLTIENLVLDGENKGWHAVSLKTNSYITLGKGAVVQNFTHSAIEADLAYVKVLDGALLQNNFSESHGGAIFASSSSVYIYGGTFKNNKSGGFGGAIDGYDYLEIKGGTFEGNEAARDGGAVYGEFKLIENATFINNKARSGGAIVCVSRNSHNAIPIKKTKFINNKAKMGGAIFTRFNDYGNPADESRYQNLDIDDTTLFQGNEASAGLSTPPSNYAKFKNLKFSNDSDTAVRYKSLLNNYDVNYGGATITYDANGGKFEDGSVIKSEHKILEDEITIAEAPKREGYKFLYWKGSEYQPGDKYIVNGDHTFVAQWEGDKKELARTSLTLDENYRGGNVSKKEVIVGEAMDPYLYKPKRRGFTFKGWSYNRKHLDGVHGDDIIEEPITVYAIWDEVEEEPEEIKGMTHKAYIFGYPDGAVRPNGEITRAEAAAMLARLLEIESIGSAEAPSFPDTPSAWYNKAINAVIQRDIMKGYPDGTFKPNDAITRAEFTQMISTIDNKPYGTAPFADVVGHWAERPIGSEYQAGRILGYPDGTFRPDAHITRCEAAVILNKIFERNFDAMSLLKCKNPQMIKYFTDLYNDFWGYNEMVEATNTHEYVRRNTNRVEENWLLIK